MPLTLKTVEAGHGSRWVGDAFRLFARKPLAFTAMGLLPGVLATLLPVLPLGMAVLSLFSLPLLSLGFMVAAQSALLNGPVHVRQILEPLRGDPARRRALFKLCAGYVLLLVLASLVAATLSSGALAQLQGLDRTSPEFATKAEALAPSLSRAIGVMLLLYALISVPYWHAPALVHWGGQGAKQALFSSTLALWRTRGAVAVYLLCWAGVLLLVFLLAAILGSAIAVQGPSAVVAFVAVLMTAALYAVFYISALFCFNDTFGNAPARAPAEEPLPPR